ncbi:MAG: tRNA (adenosine(37)-N6)-threonylcarbamoyltransferase complex dimerization subunit type 1 TsaB, partial [Lachnospiraceae bacterium]|nr:tRNA (adenosine(37)-N6)-threonylcarbamoyltransferase complex dimerization subunit type 1 TsaB [Lachnospiraceae bacterium]
MNILAIDTAGDTASVAVSGREGRICEKKNTDSLDHLKSLMQLVSAALSECEMEKQELDAIAVTTGPGSFTGIRIGMAAARTLAQVLGVKVAPVMTLDAYLYHDYPAQGSFLLCPIMDARRENVFGAVYEMPERRKVVSEGLYHLEEWIDRLPSDRTLVFTGNGASQYEDQIRSYLWKSIIPETNNEKKNPELTEPDARSGQPPVIFVDYRHHAASVLQCARVQNKLVDYSKAEPVYLRKAEAEIKRAEGKLGLRARKKIERDR